MTSRQVSVSSWWYWESLLSTGAWMFWREMADPEYILLRLKQRKRDWNRGIQTYTENILLHLKQRKRDWNRGIQTYTENILLQLKQRKRDIDREHSLTTETEELRHPKYNRGISILEHPLTTSSTKQRHHHIQRTSSYFIKKEASSTNTKYMYIVVSVLSRSWQLGLSYYWTSRHLYFVLGGVGVCGTYFL